MLKIDLSSKVAIVTGGSRGVGRGICRKLQKAGARVVINYSSEKGKSDAAELVEELTSAGGDAVAVQANISNPDEVKSMFEKTVDQFNKVDILVNNAGVTSVGTIEDISDSELDKIMKVNTYGSFYTSRECIKYLKQNNGGSIINIASTGLFTGGGGGPHYAASKAAILGLTRNLSKTYGKFGIRANALAISLINTELFRNRYSNEEDRQQVINQVPVRRLGTPEDVGNMVAFIASPLASYLNGELIVLDGGRLYG